MTMALKQQLLTSGIPVSDIEIWDNTICVSTTTRSYATLWREKLASITSDVSDPYQSPEGNNRIWRVVARLHPTD
jgi:hypothetical protein